MNRRKLKVKQRDSSDCGAACLASVAAFYNLRIPVSKIRQYASTDTKGTNIKGLLEAAEQLGFSAKGVKGDVDSLSKIPLPAIAHIETNSPRDHYVVIYKVSKNKVQFMDPGSGKIFRVTTQDFLTSWTKVLVILIPGETFEEGNDVHSVWKRFYFLAKPHRSILIQAFFGAIVVTILGLTPAIFLQKIVDHVFTTGNKGLLNLLGVAMVLVLFLNIFLGIFRTIFVTITAQQIDTRLTLGYYKHLLRLPQQFFNTMRVGEIISRIGDAGKIRSFINEVALGLVLNVLTVVFSFTLMFIYSWKLTLIMLGIIPPYIAIYFLLNRFNKKFLRRMMEQSADLQSQLVESLEGMETIKRFGIEDHAIINTEMRYVKLLKTGFEAVKFGVFTGSSMQFTTRIFTITILWAGSYFVLNNEITPGTLLSFHAIIGRFTGPLRALVGSNTAIQNALIAADRLFELMDLEQEKSENQRDLNADDVGDIRFQKINFRYGTRKDVFTDFSLCIPKGKMTAIVGESGSGKTTLTSLLQKLYKPQSGSIFIGEYDINYIGHESLRSLVAAVPQKVDLFGDNVIKNIALGEFEPDMLRITRICEQLGILKFIEELPNSFETHLGEKGVALSGGQQQRIAIARALYMNPEIFILDEATSHLDTTSEKHVYNAISKLREEGKTMIIIAHRLSTILNADNIVVLKDGKLVEQGSFEQLKEQEGEFCQLWRDQIQTT